MRRFALALAVALVGNPSVARATADGPDCWRVRDVARTDTLSLREKPSTKAKVLAKIPHDARCLKAKGELADAKGRVVQDSDEAPFPKDFRAHWRKIEYGGQVGWAAFRYLGEDSAP